ncbi:GNAT family N-acetyltransferase [Nonomuraea endophytica]|uniref:Ribosomal protein S18 acetylase RimI-like enzyme n=1 Tax=Nonomuraea endophytica TaxID=714136 RepID=A0A7W8A0S5_9ACTN|nr:GNAT family N-acetyltransferase [Nonomuraea endophytica]MBB5077452.1 ribosomal protein S18 acetylase RimI-like enzyme [Nonomuraea endophytica]
MDIRPVEPADLPALVDLACTVFGPFYLDSFRPVVGETVFANRHGDWKGDYRRHLAGVHDPANGKFAAAAFVDDQLAGFVGWVVQESERHGEIDILAVTPGHRRLGLGRALLEHAMTQIKATGKVEMVSIGTGGDAFHAPARALYESFGFTPFPQVNYTRAI